MTRAEFIKMLVEEHCVGFFVPQFEQKQAAK
jgi:hypothetical protein